MDFIGMKAESSVNKSKSACRNIKDDQSKDIVFVWI